MICNLRQDMTQTLLRDYRGDRVITVDDTGAHWGPGGCGPGRARQDHDKHNPVTNSHAPDTPPPSTVSRSRATRPRPPGARHQTGEQAGAPRRESRERPRQEDWLKARSARWRVDSPRRPPQGWRGRPPRRWRPSRGSPRGPPRCWRGHPPRRWRPPRRRRRCPPQWPGLGRGRGRS